jgi:ubiquinone/menaquinone biosynthesis C-methylase UbiE
LARTYGFNVTGLDLVPHNVKLAVRNAKDQAVPADFVIGNAGSLPFADDSFSVSTAFDAIAYMPEKAAVFAELARTLDDDGLVAISDLVITDNTSATQREAVAAFTNAWDMAPLVTIRDYQRLISDAGLVIDFLEDVSTNSTARFRKWTSLYLELVEHVGDWIDRLLRHWNLDPATVTEHVRLANEALPFLRHIIVISRTPS